MKSIRTIFFGLHLAAGCIAGLAILAISATGILLAFERQINAWADAPAVLNGHADSTSRASLDSVVAALKSDGEGIPDRLVLHKTSNAPIEVRYGRSRTLLLNPWSAEIRRVHSPARLNVSTDPSGLECKAPLGAESPAAATWSSSFCFYRECISGFQSFQLG